MKRILILSIAFFALPMFGIKKIQMPQVLEIGQSPWEAEEDEMQNVTPQYVEEKVEQKEANRPKLNWREQRERIRQELQQPIIKR